MRIIGAPSAAAAAEYYPPIYSYSMLRMRAGLRPILS
jgi:hypothetical protein